MPPSGLQVYEALAADAAVLAAVQRLVPQLSTSAATPTEADVAELCAADAAHLLLARIGCGGRDGDEGGDGVGGAAAGAGHAAGGGDGVGGDAAGGGDGAAGAGDAGRDSPDIVGMLVLVLFRLPTGMRAWIEDVVVDSRARGLGVGEALMLEALARAAAAGAVTVDLTARPSREAAVRLYRRLGFEPRPTGVYRYAAGARDRRAESDTGGGGEVDSGESGCGESDGKVARGS